MPEPLSIATGVTALLKATYTVGVELKTFRDGVVVVHSTLNGLIKDVDGLESVLEAMQGTFESITAGYGTGHVGSHWTNIARSLEDGKEIVKDLQAKLDEVNKSTRVLDAARKQLRLNFATEKIASYRMSIQSYRDALQLSLQTVILWNQVTQNEQTELVLPTLSELQAEIRRMASGFNERIADLQASVMSAQDKRQEAAVGRLRDCVKSAASIVSSASTIMATEKNDARSDFGDCFPEHGVMLERWADSRTVYGDDDQASLRPPESMANVRVVGESDDDSESDDELEHEITLIILNNAEGKLQSHDDEAAERMLQNCLTRLGANKRGIPHVEGIRLGIHVMSLLYGLYER